MDTKRVFKELKFYFRNGDTWTVDHKEMSDIWLARVTTSYGRINGGKMQEIHPCKSFKIEILKEANYQKETDKISMTTSVGMFDRVMNYQDIEKCDLIFDDVNTDENLQIYFPFKAKNSEGLDNIYQTSAISKQNENLYVVIDAKANVFDKYQDRL
ncbi:hypothetical protein RD055328_06530 [Companilactobacillus sp. RD055328]|uniref:hypothetical protein n=1 Tax=Companilactobacillus sp. RD055328 TaxID=2916634 RepID=UPI001FC7E7C4|nr:hypothetical protein [Companilactobacillus sp. RD055328]GKQ42730.1 hypothetical protein RD055328_06530 [Companilactobacillus sp. RD055328]